MRELKFRQAIFHPVTKKFCRWHYWGLIDETFYGIDTGWVTPVQAIENSYQYIGLKDKHKCEIYDGDTVRPFYTIAGYGKEQEVYWGIGAWEPFSGNCDSDHTYRYEIVGNKVEGIKK